eukprot:PhF_6_TR3700/c0_g1_i1/m.5278
MSKAAKERKRQAKEEAERRKFAADRLEDAKKALDKNQWPKVIAECDAAIEKCPDTSEAYSYKAVALKEQGNIEGATELYNKAIDLNPAEAVIMGLALSGRAQCFDLLGKKDEAIEDYTKFIHLNPHSDYAYNMRGMVRLSKRLNGLRLKNADLTNVLDDFHKAIELNENNYHALSNLGHALFDHQRFKDAITEYSRALQLKDDYYYVYYRRGIAYMEQVLHDEHEEEMAKERALQEAEKDELGGGREGGGKRSSSPRANTTGASGSQDTSGTSGDAAMAQIIADEVHEAILKERKQFMRLAIADLTKVIQEDRSMRAPDDDSGCNDPGAFLRRGMCYMYLGGEFLDKALDDLTAAVKLCQKDQQEAASNGTAPRWNVVKPVAESKLSQVRGLIASKTQNKTAIPV